MNENVFIQRISTNEEEESIEEKEKEFLAIVIVAVRVHWLQCAV